MSNPIQEAVLVVEEDDTKYKKEKRWLLFFIFKLIIQMI